MKKLFAFVLVCGFAFAVVSCGAKKSVEDAAKAIEDSIRKVDSIAKVEAEAALAKFKADSARVADSLANIVK